MKFDVNRILIYLAVSLTLLFALAACGSATPETVTVKETVVVEKEITVKETVIVEGETQVVEVVVTATPEPEAAAEEKSEEAMVETNTGDKLIALSNNYAGNSWRQTMLKQWEEVTGAAVADGVVGQVDAFTTAENEATEQAAQIQDMILQGYDAIVLNAASPTALNGVVKEACDAGIVVVSFDGIVTEPCAWRLAVDFSGMGLTQMDWLAEHMSAGGKLLEIRGLAGTSIDDAIAEGIAQGVETYPQFEIVGSVHGDWTQTVAQKEVAGILPSLPEVDAIVTQGGDGVGAIQAFKAEGRDVPLVIFGNRHDELTLWKELQDSQGYETISLSIAPGVGTLAFWVAQQILDGNEPPKDLVVPFDVITSDTLDERLAATEEGAVATRDYSLNDALEVIESAK